MAYKVLIIDDTPVIRDFLTEVMNDAGFDVDIAINGRVGYEMAVEHEYVMIFCDVHMPIMNGLEAIKKIKRVKPDMPIVMTDSFPDKMAEQATEAGALCCLTKPFALEDVRKTINRIVESKKVKTT